MAAILIVLFVFVLAMIAARILNFTLNHFWTILAILIVAGFLFYAHYGSQ